MAISDAINSFGGIALNIVITIVLMIVSVGVIIFAFWYIRRLKRYSQFVCRIFERDGFGQLVEAKSDKAGIFVDGKTKNKLFFLKKNNVGIDPNNVPYIQRGSKKIVYLLKTGLKNFHFIKLNFNFHPNPGLSAAFDVGEADVNWAVNAYAREKKIFLEGWLAKYGPLLGLFFISIIILIMFIFLFKNIGVLARVANAFRDAAQAFAQAQAGTVVVE